MINFSWAGLLDFDVIKNYSAGEGHEYRIYLLLKNFAIF